MSSVPRWERDGNIDTITNFTVGVDHIRLDNTIFTAFAKSTSVASDQVCSGAGINTASDANEDLFYNTSTGALYYDADGTGNTSAAIQFALLQNTPLAMN